MQDKWNSENKEIFMQYKEGGKALFIFLSGIIQERETFKKFLKTITEEPNYQYGEGFHILMPESLIDDGVYTGKVELIWSNFTEGQEDEISYIGLDDFCLLVKRASIFFVRYVEPDFNPKPNLRLLDALLEKHTLVS